MRIRVARHPGLQGAQAYLFLALDEHLDANRQIVAQSAQGHGVHDDTALVVGRPAPVQPPVAEGGPERLRGPRRLVAGRLHVVMPVEEDGGLAGRRGPLAEDGVRPPGYVEQPHVRQPSRPQQDGDGLRRIVQVLTLKTFERDGGDLYEALQLRPRLGHERLHAPPKLGQIRRPASVFTHLDLLSDYRRLCPIRLR